MLGGGVLSTGGERLADIVRSELSRPDRRPPGRGALRGLGPSRADRRSAHGARRHSGTRLRHLVGHRRPARSPPENRTVGGVSMPASRHHHRRLAASGDRRRPRPRRDGVRGDRAAARTTTRTPRRPSRSGTAGAHPTRSRRSRTTSPAFEKVHPNITVKAVSNITDDKINQALRAGGPKAPDVVSSFTTDNVGEFCSSHAFVDLDAVPQEVGDRPCGDVPPGAARLHAVPGGPVLAAAPQRRLRPLLQQGDVREGRHHRAAQDPLRVRRRCRQADEEQR